MSARSRLKKMFKDGQSEFSHRYTTWANNHNGWSKQKKMNRRTAKHSDNNKFQKELDDESDRR